MTFDELIASQSDDPRDLSENVHLADWVHELRHGTRKQGRGAMRTLAGEFCCMGVACDMADVELVAAADMPGFGVPVALLDPGTMPDHETASLGYLPNWLRDMFGLEAGGFGLTTEDMGTLSDMNDTYVRSFADIADVIELWFRLRMSTMDEAWALYQDAGF